MADENNDAAAAAKVEADAAAARAAADTAGAPPPAETAKTAERPAKTKAGAKADGGLVEATVLRGTIMIGKHGAEVGVGPGGKVSLPADQVAELRTRGVLVDPDAPPSFASGPVSDIDKVGPQVTTS